MAYYDHWGIYDKEPARLMSKDGLVSFTAEGERLDSLGHRTGTYTNPDDLIDMVALGLWGQDEQRQDEQRQDDVRAAGRDTPQGESAYQDYRAGERSAGGGVSGVVGSGQGAGALGRPQVSNTGRGSANNAGYVPGQSVTPGVGASWPAAEQAMRPYRHVQLESGRTIVVATGDMSGVEVVKDDKGNQYVKNDPPRWLGVPRFDNERAPQRPQGNLGDSWSAVGAAMRQAQDEGWRRPTRDGTSQGFDFLNPGQRLPEVDGQPIREPSRTFFPMMGQPAGRGPLDMGQPFTGGQQVQGWAGGSSVNPQYAETLRLQREGQQRRAEAAFRAEFFGGTPEQSMNFDPDNQGYASNYYNQNILLPQVRAQQAAQPQIESGGGSMLWDDPQGATTVFDPSKIPPDSAAAQLIEIGRQLGIAPGSSQPYTAAPTYLPMIGVQPKDYTQELNDTYESGYSLGQTVGPYSRQAAAALDRGAERVEQYFTNPGTQNYPSMTPTNGATMFDPTGSGGLDWGVAIDPNAPSGVEYIRRFLQGYNTGVRP